MGYMHNATYSNAEGDTMLTAELDMDMIINLFVSDEAEVCVFHDKAFSKTISWLEYDVASSKVDFVMEDGDIRNFGIPVKEALRPYFHNAHIVSLIQLNATTKQVEGGIDLPLIIHAA